MRLGFNDGKALLVSVALWDLRPVGGEVFKVVEQRSHLPLEVSLRNKNAHRAMHGAFSPLPNYPQLIH